MLERPTKKTRAHLIYIDPGVCVHTMLLFNQGNWDWVEERDYIRVCVPCHVVYPPNLNTTVCPRHGSTNLVSDAIISLRPLAATSIPSASN